MGPKYHSHWQLYTPLREHLESEPSCLPGVCLRLARPSKRLREQLLPLRSESLHRESVHPLSVDRVLVWAESLTLAQLQPTVIEHDDCTKLLLERLHQPPGGLDVHKQDV